MNKIIYNNLIEQEFHNNTLRRYHWTYGKDKHQLTCRYSSYYEFGFLSTSWKNDIETTGPWSLSWTEQLYRSYSETINYALQNTQCECEWDLF